MLLRKKKMSEDDLKNAYDDCDFEFDEEAEFE